MLEISTITVLLPQHLQLLFNINNDIISLLTDHLHKDSKHPMSKEHPLYNKHKKSTLQTERTYLLRRQNSDGCILLPENGWISSDETISLNYRNQSVDENIHLIVEDLSAWPRVVALIARLKRLGDSHIRLSTFIENLQQNLKLLFMLERAGLDELSPLSVGFASEEIQHLYQFADFAAACSLVKLAQKYKFEISWSILISDSIIKELPKMVSSIKYCGTNPITLIYPEPHALSEAALKFLPAETILHEALKKLLITNPENISITNLPEKLQLSLSAYKQVLPHSTAKLEEVLHSQNISPGIEPFCMAENRCKHCWLRTPCENVRKTMQRMKRGKELSVNLVLQSDCNNRCLFCTFRNMDAPNSEYPHTPMVDILRDLKSGIDKGGEELVIVGTEPLEYKNLPQIVKLAKKLGYKRVTLQTHGEDFCEQTFVDEMQKAGVSEVRIGIYGSCSSTHDIVAGAKGSFKRVISAMENLQKSRIKLVVHLTLCKQNLKEIMETEILLNKMNIILDSYQLVEPFTTDVDRYREVVPRISTVFEAFISSFNAAQKISSDAMREKHLHMVDNMVKRISNARTLPCLLHRAKTKTNIPFRVMQRPGDFHNLQMSISHIEKDGSIKENFLRSSRHDIKTAVICPHNEDCAYGNRCPGLHELYVRAYGLEEFKPVDTSELT